MYGFRMRLHIGSRMCAISQTTGRECQYLLLGHHVSHMLAAMFVFEQVEWNLGGKIDGR